MRIAATLTAIQVVFLIALQGTSIVVLWLLNPLTQSATDTFALFLSVDLLAFAMMSYLYRSRRSGVEASSAWLAVGYLALIVLLVSNLLMA
ncbi:MAG: hypothetical protein JRM74_04245 [Nitrososphaerota archaeon]|nr:hypothetical protein [Nitrososphaerota archaeon]MDG6960273.1 hypothetical protein [Nitrososphaerota archaeon]MDG6969393.1 hypothetical protein [Nitrososphaerota archaeon]MDG6982647.1 hypothetical protein [Nitrososphaerota archaeon]MDG6987306.1 hypothetical protein [Nitrososphaerota archaeon]